MAKPEQCLNNSIDMGFSKLELKEGYIRQTYLKDTTIDLEKAVKINHSIEKLTQKKKLPLLLIGSNGIQPTLEVRKYGSTKRANKYTSALAIVISKRNLAQRILGNFIVNVDKRPMPTKIFTNEKDAKFWIDKYILN